MKTDRNPRIQKTNTSRKADYSEDTIPCTRKQAEMLAGRTLLISSRNGKIVSKYVTPAAASAKATPQHDVERFRVIEGECSDPVPSCDDRDNVLARFEYGDVYQFKPATYYWRQAARARPAAVSEAIIAEVVRGIRDLQKFDLECDEAFWKSQLGQVLPCNQNLAQAINLLERVKAEIYKFGGVAGKKVASFEELRAKPRISRLLSAV